MNQRLFVRLATPRPVHRPELPRDLAQFYAENEPVEFEVADNYSIYLNSLQEVKEVSWDGLEMHWDRPEGWEKFAAFLIGGGCYGERIVSVIDAPCCQPGAILALGGELNWGPGGTGPFASECTLVLGSSFSEWLHHLEEEEWWEYTIGYGIPDLSLDHQRRLRAYYLTLNPHIEWPEP